MKLDLLTLLANLTFFFHIKKGVCGNVNKIYLVESLQVSTKCFIFDV